MKLKILSIGIIVTIIACTKFESDTPTKDSTETLLQKTDSVIQSSQKKNQQLDSITTLVVEKATENINDLHEKINVVERQKNSVKSKVIYKIDTIYIEKKKNFWGKEKTKVNTSSSQTETEIIDTTDNK